MSIQYFTKASADASLLVWVQHSECRGSQVNSSLQQSGVRDTTMSLIVQKSKYGVKIHLKSYNVLRTAGLELKHCNFIRNTLSHYRGCWELAK